MNILAIDVGGTFIKYALMDENANILEKSKTKTPIEKDNTLDDYIDVIISIYEKYKGQIDGIAMSAPGVLDSETGKFYSGGTLSYVSGHNLVELLESKCDVPVTIENDGKCAALAELWKGTLKGKKNGAVMILGTGLGGGIIIDGKLYKGSNFSAGEFSYVVNGYENINDLDGYWGMIGGIGNLLKLTSIETGISVEELDGIKIFEMANNNDERALNALDTYTRQLAVKIYNLQSLLDLDIVAIGGGISQQPLLIQYLQKNITELVENNPLKIISDFIPTPVVKTCEFFNDSNLIGALYNHLTKKEMMQTEQ